MQSSGCAERLAGGEVEGGRGTIAGERGEWKTTFETGLGGGYDPCAKCNAMFSWDGRLANGFMV